MYELKHHEMTVGVLLEVDYLEPKRQKFEWTNLQVVTAIKYADGFYDRKVFCLVTACNESCKKLIKKIDWVGDCDTETWSVACFQEQSLEEKFPDFEEWL
jgi:hypothetical protein